MARSILDQAHALQLQSMEDLGRIRELDRTLAGALMAEFSRVQLIVQEDVGKSLVALRSDFLDSCSTFIAYVARVMDVSLADPRSALLRASLKRFRRQASLKFDLPLVEMEAAEVDITTFMNTRLQELSSQTELPELIKEAARLMCRHNNRIWELVQDPDLDLSGVSSRVIIGLLEQNLPAETTEAVLIPIRNELYGKDYPHVQEIRARLLSLAPDVTPTDAQINASPRFALRPAAIEKEAPDIVTDYWMPYLEKNNRLADCPPEGFNATDGWVPLYTPEKLEEHLPAALSAFGSAKPPRLTAVVPPNFPLGIDKEFMLTSFHVRGCLRRASLMVNGKWRQIAFCPYCGVTNENAETGLNHVRKHLDVMLVCGGCHTKSVCLGQALQKHMKDNCPAILAILGKTRGGRK